MTVLTHPVTRWNERGRLVEDRACAYCWSTFTQKRTNQYHCSPECSKRDQAWNGWVRDTQHAGTHGDVRKPVHTGPALPPAGASLAASVERFEVAARVADFAAQVEQLFELVEVGS